jgi:FdhD protein
MHPPLRLTAASAPLTKEVAVRDEFGAERQISIPAERPLTVFVDKRELVTLMTLGAAPELLVLGYLRNQRLVDAVADVDSITVDWEVGAAAVKTRAGIERFDEKTAKRVVTTGCGQGTVFGHLMSDLEVDRAAAGERPGGPHRPGRALWPAERHPPPGEHLQVGRLGAWLRALSASRSS